MGGKYANTELMKVVNFLHLTPPVVSQHCAAIAKFCTPWPKGLETDEDVEKHFPLTVVTSDRCPYRGQNMDYAHYLLTALYHESWRVEEWEKKEQADMEVFEVEGDDGQERVALKE